MVSVQDRLGTQTWLSVLGTTKLVSCCGRGQGSFGSLPKVVAKGDCEDRLEESWDDATASGTGTGAAPTLGLKAAVTGIAGAPKSGGSMSAVYSM